MPYVFQRTCIVLGIFDQDVNDKLSFAMLFGQVGGLFIIASLAAHVDGGIQIKLQITR